MIGLIKELRKLQENLDIVSAYLEYPRQRTFSELVMPITFSTKLFLAAYSDEDIDDAMAEFPDLEVIMERLDEIEQCFDVLKEYAGENGEVPLYDLKHGIDNFQKEEANDIWLKYNYMRTMAQVIYKHAIPNLIKRIEG